MFGKRHMEKGKIGTWRQMQQMKQKRKYMKRRRQKEHSKQIYILITKHAMINLKYCYYSILLVKYSYVYVYVSNTTKTTERVK